MCTRSRLRLVLLSLLLAAAGGLSVYAQSDFHNQWPAAVYPVEQPRGKVKSVTETAYTMSEIDAEKIFKYKLILRYDTGGSLLSEEYYNEDGSSGNRIDYLYENGQLVLKMQSHPGVQNPDREIFQRSPDGRILEAEKIFSTGNYGWKFRNSYDQDGKIILTSKYDRYWNWQLVYSRMFEYDDSGLLIATEGFGMQSELLWRDEYVYDDNGRLLESVKYNPEGELVVRITDEYNDSEQLTRQKLYDVKNRCYAVYSYGWDYDETGNWIAKVVGHEAEGTGAVYLIPDSMITRKIEYYE